MNFNKHKIVATLKMLGKLVMLVVMGLFGGALGMAFTDSASAYPHYMSPGAPGNSISGGLVASASTLVVPGYQTRISGTTAIDTIQLPWEGFEGTLVLIPTAIWTLSTSGNVGLAATAVVGKAMHITYSQQTSKWYPSYTS